MNRSFLTRLPRELRDQIYDNAMISVSETIHLRKESHRVVAFGEIEPLQMSGLLLTCRQMHEEATERLYGVKTFSITEEALEQYLDTVGEINSHKLQNIHIQTYGNEGYFWQRGVS